MAAGRRTDRDARRRKLGQNFLSAAAADRIVAGANVQRGELVLDIGAGRGAFTRACVRHGARVLAIEPDPDWAAHLQRTFAQEPNVSVRAFDFLAMRLPAEPFRVIGSLPFARTTEILHRLLDHPSNALQRMDVIVQWEVALKRAQSPPDTLLSTAWAPWWEVRLMERIPAAAFRPVPRVDGGLISITRRESPVLPERLAPAFAHFVRANWPFA